MANYSIDTMGGDEICADLRNLGEAQELAQSHANRRGESVWLYGDDLGEDGVEFEPELNVRIFRGNETKQVELDGQSADPEKWYFEPSDYDGDILWSSGYESRAEAYHAAGCSRE